MALVRAFIPSAVLGFVAAFSFPPHSFAPFLLPILLAGWFWILARKPGIAHGIFAGLGFGLGYFINLLSWMAVVGTDTWLMLAGVCALWWAAASPLLARLLGSRDELWAVPSLFTLAEALRDRIPWGGFGWGQFGQLSPGLPLVSTWSPVVGQVWITWLLVAVAVLLLRWRKHWRPAAIVALSLTILALGWPRLLPPVTTAGGLKLALVQGGVEHIGLGTLGPARAVLANHVEVSRLNLAQLQAADLVVWPESSIDSDPFLDPIAADMLLDLQRDIGKPLIAGAVLHRSPTTVANVTLLIDGGQIKEVYQKRRLVPFGEFLPLREIVNTYTDRAALIPRDFLPGDEPGWISIGGVGVGLVICFEAADDRLAADQPQPVSVIVVQTNNATYQYLGQSEQQLLAARQRAIELATPVVSISTSGVSAVVDKHGQITDSLSQDEVGVMSTEIDSVTQDTPARHLAPITPLLVAGLAGLALVRLRRVRP